MDKDSFTTYNIDSGKNITESETTIKYSYVIPLNEIVKELLLFFVGGIIFIFLGILIQRYVDKKSPEKKSGSK